MRMPRLLEKDLESFAVNNERCRVHERVEPECADCPCILINNQADPVRTIERQTEWRNGPRFHTEKLFQILR